MSTPSGTQHTILEEHERLLEQMRRWRDELDHFVRALSHDMTANFILLESSFERLKRSLHTASREELQQQVVHVEACLRESKRFLDDLVQLARTGSVQMVPCRVSLDEVIDEVLFEQRELLDGRRVLVEVQRPLGTVWCNRHRVKQVLANLLRNAVKHGCSPTQPAICLSSQTESNTPEGKPMVMVRVHDNGPGIPPKHHEEVFLPGRRLAHAAPEGSGMGLAIVKKIVEHYGGSVRVDADCLTGTAMILRLPAPIGEPLPQPHYESRLSDRSKRRSGSRAERSKGGHLRPHRR